MQNKINIERIKQFAGEIKESLHMLAILGEGVWDWELQSGRVRHDAQWSRLMGLDVNQIDHTWQEALAFLDEEEQLDVKDAIQACLDGKASFSFDHHIRYGDGRVAWLENRGEVVGRDATGKPLRMVGSLRGVTEQKHDVLRMQRRNLILQTIAAVNEMLMADLSEQELMGHICTELTRNNLFRMAWVGLVNEDGVSVRPVAEAGFFQDYLRQLDIRCDDTPQGQGPTGHRDPHWRHRHQPRY